MQTETDNNQILENGLLNLFSISITITSKHGKPALELRSLTTNPIIIKNLISSAYHNRPLIIMPKFTDLMQSLNSCIQKGILIRDEDGNYFFTEDFENLNK